MAVISANINILIKAAETAAKSLIRDFGEVEQLQVSMKGPADFVSAADRRAEEILYKELKKARPSFGFLMEETGESAGSDAEHRFIVDPLDGTLNFLHGLPHWCISLALERNNEIIAGVIYDPVKDETFRAEKGAGAFLNKKRLRVSGRKDLSAAMIGSGDMARHKDKIPAFTQELAAVSNACAGFRRQGAAALDLAYVAAGRLEAFWERNLKPWDIAAGSLIVKEAGGFITDLENAKNPVYGKALLASNANLHTAIKSLLLDA